jgi:hypothetical protein
MFRTALLQTICFLALAQWHLGAAAGTTYERVDLYDTAQEFYQRRDCVGVIKYLYGFKVLNEELLSKDQEWNRQIDGIVRYCEELIYRQLADRRPQVPSYPPGGAGWGGYGWGPE